MGKERERVGNEKESISLEEKGKGIKRREGTGEKEGVGEVEEKRGRGREKGIVTQSEGVCSLGGA